MHYVDAYRSVAQPGSAPALGAGCRRFKSSRSDHKANPPHYGLVMRQSYSPERQTPASRREFGGTDEVLSICGEQTLYFAGRFSARTRLPCAFTDKTAGIRTCGLDSRACGRRDSFVRKRLHHLRLVDFCRRAHAVKFRFYTSLAVMAAAHTHTALDGSSSPTSCARCFLCIRAFCY